MFYCEAQAKGQAKGQTKGRPLKGLLKGLERSLKGLKTAKGSELRSEERGTVGVEAGEKGGVWIAL